jgi:putative membrane protein
MLTPDDRSRIRAAVDKAEASLAAEIVPCVFRESGHYPETIWAGAAVGAALAAAALLLADVLAVGAWWPLWRSALCVPAAGLVGAALGRWVPPLKRFFIGAHHMEESVARRAKEVFFDRGVDRTKARDGVLIFASLLERRVVVLADAAVRERVAEDAWEPVVRAMTAAAAQGRVGDGLVAAVEEAAEILAAAGLSGRGGGELPDEPVEEDDA